MKKDGTKSVQNTLKYYCYDKSRKVCSCSSQTNYVAKKIDDVVMQIMRQLFENMKGAPEEEEYKKYMELQKKTLIANLRKVTRELEKDKQQLQTLQLEIGKTLLGDSIYSPEDLKEAIKVIKSKIQSEEEKTEKIKEELNAKKNNDDKGKESYKRFKSWAEEFDSADMEQKTMIACQLFDKIEVAAGYKLYIQINATYQQFCQGMDINKVIKKMAG